jgi:cation diffusion facilitator CzcD-associated flavoprotein CzcO
METFAGPVIHSSKYRNPAPYAGKRVLVIGFGNSGGEIALDLAEAGIDTSLAVRGPVQILPRDLLGIPILTWSIAQRKLPTGLVDLINMPGGYSFAPTRITRDSAWLTEPGEARQRRRK